MRIELAIDGGFAYVPGLRPPVVVDDAQLPGADAAQLRRLCAAALAAADAPAPPPPGPDARRYRLTIDSDGTTRELAASDPVGSPALAQLIGFLEARRAR